MEDLHDPREPLDFALICDSAHIPSAGLPYAPVRTEGPIMPNATVSSRQEHREAVLLSWKSRHLPVGTILIGALLMSSLLPTILTIIAQGPVNPIP